MQPIQIPQVDEELDDEELDVDDDGVLDVRVLVLLAELSPLLLLVGESLSLCTVWSATWVMSGFRGQK